MESGEKQEDGEGLLVGPEGFAGWKARRQKGVSREAGVNESQ